jgi:Cu(I)/Ag(I) efflux system membrane protein CusA/SilA
MGHFSMEISCAAGSLLSGNQQLGFNAFVTVAVGFIYLNHALKEEQAKCEAGGRKFEKEDLNRAIMVGAVERVRPR